jgi:UDP-GlcNAc:undecaprenyl-phosphate GlcNAc-1-phosphate transferase
MTIDLYLMPFLQAFAVSVAVIFAVLRLAGRGCGIVARSGGRHIHAPHVTRWGGIGVIVSFLAVLCLNGFIVMTQPLWGMAFASVSILVFGAWDDLKELSWRSQLAFQAALALAACGFGIRFLSLSLPWGGAVFFDTLPLLVPSVALSVLWILFIMNATNWSDGMDGLCGGFSFIGFLAIFFLSLKPEVNQPAVAILAAALAGGTLGFLAFNFHPAKIMAGTSGAWFFGFMLAALSLFAGTKAATALLVLVLPALDAVWVAVDRFRSGDSLFQADSRHLHYRLLGLGWTPLRISLFFYAVTGAAAAAALNVRSFGKLLTIVVVVPILAATLLWAHRKTRGSGT